MWSELLLLEPVPHPLAGALVLITPIEPHFVTLGTLALSIGIIVYDFKVWLRMSPLSW